MKKAVVYLFLICFVALFIAAKEKRVRILLAGDSTMADKPILDNPERGWGMVLPSYFNKNVVIENYTRNGRSTRSFIDEGRWVGAKVGLFCTRQLWSHDAGYLDVHRFSIDK